MVPLVEQELDPSGAHEFSPGLQWGSRCSSFSILSSVLWISVFSSFSSFSVDHFVVCPSLICGFWLLLRYIQLFFFLLASGTVLEHVFPYLHESPELNLRKSLLFLCNCCSFFFNLSYMSTLRVVLI